MSVPSSCQSNTQIDGLPLQRGQDPACGTVRRETAVAQRIETRPKFEIDYGKLKLLLRPIAKPEAIVPPAPVGVVAVLDGLDAIDLDRAKRPRAFTSANIPSPHCPTESV